MYFLLSSLFCTNHGISFRVPTPTHFLRFQSKYGNLSFVKLNIKVNAPIKKYTQIELLSPFCTANNSFENNDSIFFYVRSCFFFFLFWHRGNFLADSPKSNFRIICESLFSISSEHLSTSSF